MIKNAQSTLQTIGEHKAELHSLGVVRVGVFGSVARGKASANSDVDVMVDFVPNKKTYRNFFGTATLLESILQSPVDVITPASVSPYLKPYIEKDIQYVQISH